MTIERSHGKARPTLPRVTDLRLVPAGSEAVAQRRGARDARGRFTGNNTAAVGSGGRAAIRRLLGATAKLTDAAAIAVARDAARVFSATLRELPNDGAVVRQLCASYSRHTALAAFWSARAGEAGLGTDEGIKAQEHASKNAQRAERLAVTMLDVASKLAARSEPDGLAALHKAVFDADAEVTE